MKLKMAGSGRRVLISNLFVNARYARKQEPNGAGTSA